MKIFALNLFNVADKEEYLAYSKRSAREVQAHGGRVVALGDPRLADLHPHRVNGSADYVWPLFDRLDDLRPLLK